MNDETKNKPLEWFWNIKTALESYSNMIREKGRKNTIYKFPFPNHIPKISLNLFVKIANEEINDCDFFLNYICPGCNDPQVVCIIEDRNSFLRYKKLKKCMKKVRNKQDNTLE